MKKIFTLLVLLFSLMTSYPVWATQANAKAELQTRLNKLDGFYSQFSQVVKTQEGDLVQEGEGELWISRPYYFNWKLSSPDELSIISDGKTVWIYTPMLEQVTAMSLSNIADNHLLLLITDSHNSIWDGYQVTRNNDLFELMPISQKGQKFQITVTAEGKIISFKIIEEDGQNSFYQLTHHKLAKIDESKFTFIIPKGVTLDDQR
ncbi:outer membrane lipoprotein chaperone LolA [Utexia brackfieldae]|uniref:outer membrane lipoprotein chaperone LolA n=1 Tax=Utexia brackfieldae TaxID=3074108 RepID=UPI00370DC08B